MNLRYTASMIGRVKPKMGVEASVSVLPKQRFEEMNREYYVNHKWKNPEYLAGDDSAMIERRAAPLMIVIGEQDTPYCHSLANQLHARLPYSTLRSISDTAHFPNLTHPDLFDQWLVEWLALNT